MKAPVKRTKRALITCQEAAYQLRASAKTLREQLRRYPELFGEPRYMRVNGSYNLHRVLTQEEMATLIAMRVRLGKYPGSAPGYQGRRSRDKLGCEASRTASRVKVR